VRAVRERNCGGVELKEIHLEKNRPPGGDKEGLSRRGFAAGLISALGLAVAWAAGKTKAEAPVSYQEASYYEPVAPASARRPEKNE